MYKKNIIVAKLIRLRVFEQCLSNFLDLFDRKFIFRGYMSVYKHSNSKHKMHIGYSICNFNIKLSDAC